jgi:ADP-ribosylglycohydrolase
MGRTSYLAIERMVNGYLPILSGLSGLHDQGNGSLMRCAPLAFFEVSDSDIIKQASITHNHDLCHLSDLILIHSIRILKNGENKWNVFEIMFNTFAQKKVLLFSQFKDIPKHLLAL